MSDEQRVRTMAGWVGVEISRSRVRTPGKAGFGLYQVRGAAERHWHVPHPKIGPDGEWTAYAFTIEQIENEIHSAIVRGVPAGPIDLVLPKPSPRPPEPAVWIIPTRWTSAYRGRRNLGLAADLEALERADPAVGAASAQLNDAVREIVARSTVRSRQREANATFQADHLRRRARGLELRYAAKRARNSASPNGPTE